MGRKTSRTIPTLLAVVAGFAAPSALAHDIPNQRVDRSIQATVTPGRLRIDYEVGLTELTLTQELRSLVGSRPGAERSEWLALYGQVTGPMNAKGFLVAVDGAPVILSATGHSLSVEEHPRYTFHLEAKIPDAGRLSIRDTNFVSSEGTSRLAIRGRDGVRLEGYDGPPDVENVPIRPVWELSDSEERQTKQVEIRYRGPNDGEKRPAERARPSTVDSTVPRQIETIAPSASPNGIDRRSWGVSRLLDDSTHLSSAMLLAIALGLGAAHAIQPGHGKTLVTAVALGPDARFYQPVLLGLATTIAHLSSVLLIAVVLWYTGTSRVATIHQGLTQGAGFVIASAGLWRLGRHLAGYGEHEIETLGDVNRSNLGLIGLGLAGGLVPCWDAVGLLVIAAAIGRLAAGVGLVLAFSAGMAAVLVVVGSLAWKVKSATVGLDAAPIWQRRLGILCGAVLTVIGLWLFFQ
jgi:nickel/cobalt transporter (NicO) family protein